MDRYLAVNIIYAFFLAISTVAILKERIFYLKPSIASAGVNAMHMSSTTIFIYDLFMIRNMKCCEDSDQWQFKETLSFNCQSQFANTCT